MRLLISLLACVAGCYHPSIADGSIFCSTDGKCPQGFMCSETDGLCYKHPPTPPSPYGTGSLGSPTLDPDGILLLDTDTGAISQQNPTTGEMKSVVSRATGIFGVGQSAGPGVAIWSFTSLTIPANVVVQVTPNSRNVPVLAATETLTLDGTIDVAKVGGANGAAGKPGDNPFGPNGGGGAAMVSTAGGGGGGGHATMGDPGTGDGHGTGGQAYGTTAPPVFFGAGGGGGYGLSGAPGVGGLGGGAVALLAPSIMVSGSIFADAGAGKDGGGGDAGGGGGGSGGTILISGDHVTIAAGANLSAVGGAGGAGAGTGGNGGKGSTGLIQLFGSVTNQGTVSPTPDSSATALTRFPQ